ncbi:MAG: hypothetical protein JOZ15_14815 [Acidobacteria bacterium]|nr:hypothetical protein [Acidobacteriota bacterium]
MISVRPTEPEDLPGLSALFAARFGHPLAPEEWAWKYRRLPGVARSLVAIDAVDAVGAADTVGAVGAVDTVGVVGAAGVVVAHAGALRLAARWHGGEGGIWQLVDFVGRAAGSGLRPALVQLGRQLLGDLPAAGEAPWIFGFPSERHFRLGERVFGYRPLASLPQLAGPLPEPSASWPRAGVTAMTAGAAASMWPRAGVTAMPAGAAASASLAGEAPPEPPPVNAAGVPSVATAPAITGGEDPGQETGVWSGDSCGDWAEAVWDRCGVLGVRRSAAFLNWRYWARPRRYYRFYRLRQGGVEGLAVFAFVGTEAWATELWLPPAGEWYSPMLAIAADLRTAGLRSWRFWPLPGSLDAAGLLQRLGILPDGEPRFVGCRGALQGRIDPVAAASGFYYAMGDHDLA